MFFGTFIEEHIKDHIAAQTIKKPNCEKAKDIVFQSWTNSIRRDISPCCWAQQIHVYLSSRAYLIASSRPTLADYDVCFALLHAAICQDAWYEQYTQFALPSPYIHLQRWMHQVVTSAVALVSRQSKHLQFYDKKNEGLTEARTFFISKMQIYHSQIKTSKNIRHSHTLIFPKDVLATRDHTLHSFIILILHRKRIQHLPRRKRTRRWLVVIKLKLVHPPWIRFKHWCWCYSECSHQISHHHHRHQQQNDEDSGRWWDQGWDQRLRV